MRWAQDYDWFVGQRAFGNVFGGTGQHGDPFRTARRTEQKHPDKPGESQFRPTHVRKNLPDQNSRQKRGHGFPEDCR